MIGVSCIPWLSSFHLQDLSFGASSILWSELPMALWHAATHTFHSAGWGAKAAAAVKWWGLLAKQRTSMQHMEQGADIL